MLVVVSGIWIFQICKDEMILPRSAYSPEQIVEKVAESLRFFQQRGWKLALDVEKKSRVVNLTQLRRNSRVRGDKKYGRKKPRPRVG